MFGKLLGRAGRPVADPSVVLRPSGVALRARRGEVLLNSALAAGVAFPHSCRVGSCTTCKCRLLSGRVRQLGDSAYVLSPDEVAAGYVLACQSLPLGDVEIEVALDAPPHPVVETAGTIVGQTALTHDIVELAVDLERPLAYTAGQHAWLGLPGLAVERPYSFAHAAPDDAPASRVHFHIRHVPGGACSGWLHGADRRGAAVSLRGPYGDFRLRRGDGTLVCVAGGSGMAPIQAMLEQAGRDGETRAVVYLFGARSQRDLYALDAIAALQRRWPARFDFVPMLSEEPADSAWTGARGLLGDRLAALPDLADAQCYLCGPPRMIDHCLARLAPLGVPETRIFLDRFLDRSHA